MFSRVEDNVVSPYLYESCRTIGAGAGGAGIYNAGRLLVVRTTVRQNRVLGIGPSNVDAPGGGVLNLGVATIGGSVLAETFAAAGGGIDSPGGLQIQDSQIARNSARFYGGGMRNTGIAVLIRTTVSGNSDGGILNGSPEGEGPGLLSLWNSTVSGNVSFRFPGSVFNASGEVKIISSTIAGGPRGELGQQSGQRRVVRSRHAG
jgi:hypothetical protein